MTNHTWRYIACDGQHWVHHSSTGHRGIDSIGVGLGEDILGPFPSRKLAIKVCNALTNAHRAGYISAQPIP